jgi:hypothetical protein
MALGATPGFGGDDKVGEDGYEIGSADATPNRAKIGDTIQLSGTGMLADHYLVVYFAVVYDNVTYVVDVGYTVSDSSGNWSFSTPVPPSVQVEDMSGQQATASTSESEVDDTAEAGTTGATDESPTAIASATNNDPQIASKLFEDGNVPATLPAAGLSEGDWLPVFDGPWHYGVYTLSGGDFYFTNTGWVEVYSDAVSDTGTSPGSSTPSATSTNTSQALLPATGWPALLVALCGVGLLVTGFVVSRRSE